MRSLETIAIIPARAGSKRLPTKNKLLLSGIPLISHSIRYAKANLNIINKIIISTDDPDIIDIACKEDVEFIIRPEHLCEDSSTTVSALKHVLETLKEEVENVILLQPTNPLRPEDLLKEAYRLYKSEGYNSLMTVTRNNQKFGKIEKGEFIPFNYSPGQRSQDLNPLYYENGLLYITKASLIMQEVILGEFNYPFIVNHPFAAVDIDHKEDLQYAEYLFKNFKKNK